MEFKAHAYQDYAIQYIEQHPISALFLDCGLGKTVITLTALYSLMFDSFEVKRALIVAPLRVARDTWPTEIEKWEHLKGLTYEVAVGSEKERMAAIGRAMTNGSRIVITNRENVPWLVSSTPWIYDMLVVDELSSFKSARAQRFKALMKVRPKLSRVVGLTGTPASNGYMDLWSQYRLLDQGQRLGKFITHYRNEFFSSRTYGNFTQYTLRPMADRAINDKISDITVSMSAVQHLKMPELLLQEETVQLSTSERKTYEQLKRTRVLEVDDNVITAANAATLCGKLCQLASGALYTPEGEVIEFHARKLDALEEIVEASNGKPVLVAYWYKHDLDRIRARLPEARRIDTGKDITDWNAGKIPVALIHPASAGHGLNLQQGGSLMVWYSLTWSLELYEQTNARLWRQGQTSQTVVIKHLITEGTVDSQIYRALQGKQTTQNALLNAVKAQMEER